MAISEAYGSLGTIENWSKEGKKELENEVYNHLEAQKMLLKEQKGREVRNSAKESNIATHSKPSGNLCRDTEKSHQRKSEPEQLKKTRKLAIPKTREQKQYSHRQNGELCNRSGFQPTGERGTQYYQE